MFLLESKEHVTPVSHGEGSQSFTWVGLDQWRPQSGSDLLLHKPFEPVVFEKFVFVRGKKLWKTK